MRTRAPKPPRDPLAPDAIERYLDRHGLVRLLVVTAALAATFVIAGMAAIAFLTVVLVTAEHVAPSAPSAVLDLVAPVPAPTDHIDPAVATVRSSQAPARHATAAVSRGTVPSPPTPPTSLLGAAAPPALSPARPSSAAARNAIPAASWAASVLASAAPATKTPPREAAAAPMATPATRPTTTPTTSPTTGTPSASAATPTAMPASSATTTAPSTHNDHDKAHHHKRCNSHKHRKGKC